MSRIDDLIRDLCPDGVEYKPLGEVGEFIRGTGIKKSDFIKEGYPCIHYGQIHTHYGISATEAISCIPSEQASTLRKAQPGDLVIATTSEDDNAVGKATVWLGDTPIAVGGDSYIFRHSLEPEYASHFFSSTSFAKQKQAHITGAKVRRIAASALSRIVVPTPPLEVQRRIVHILNQFTRLEAELEAELEARQQQYSFYLKRLFEFPSICMAEWTTLGSVAEIRSGWGFPKSEQGNATEGIPFYKVSDMNRSGNEIAMSTASNYVDKATIKRLHVKPAPIGTVVFPKIGAALRTNKKRLLSCVAAYDNNVMGLIPTPLVECRYLYYWMQLVNLSSIANDSGAVPSIRKSEMEKIRFPLLPLEEQSQIADTLDNFSIIVNDLTSGLPAEIEARRKQYEYYRDRLLTFPERV